MLDIPTIPVRETNRDKYNLPGSTLTLLNTIPAQRQRMIAKI